jgi:hypothetical protein
MWILNIQWLILKKVVRVVQFDESNFFFFFWLLLLLSLLIFDLELKEIET